MITDIVEYLTGPGGQFFAEIVFEVPPTTVDDVRKVIDNLHDKEIDIEIIVNIN
jgi:hypothetical protein